MPGSRCCSTPSCCVGIQNPIVCAIDPSRAWNPLGTGFTSLQASSRAALSTRGEYMGEINRNNDASRVSALSHSAEPGPEPRNHAFSLRFPTTAIWTLRILISRPANRPTTGPAHSIDHFSIQRNDQNSDTWFREVNINSALDREQKSPPMH